MNIFSTMAEDIRTVQATDPAAPSKFLIWLTYPGLQARWAHVINHWLWKKGLRGLARYLSQCARFGRVLRFTRAHRSVAVFSSTMRWA